MASIQNTLIVLFDDENILIRTFHIVMFASVGFEGFFAAKKAHGFHAVLTDVLLYESRLFVKAIEFAFQPMDDTHVVLTQKEKEKKENQRGCHILVLNDFP